MRDSPSLGATSRWRPQPMRRGLRSRWLLLAAYSSCSDEGATSSTGVVRNPKRPESTFSLFGTAGQVAQPCRLPVDRPVEVERAAGEAGARRPEQGRARQRRVPGRTGHSLCLSLRSRLATLPPFLHPAQAVDDTGAIGHRGPLVRLVVVVVRSEVVVPPGGRQAASEFQVKQVRAQRLIPACHLSLLGSSY